MPEQWEANPGAADRQSGQWAAPTPRGPFPGQYNDGWGSEGPGGFDGHMQDRMRGSGAPVLMPAPPGSLGDWIPNERRNTVHGRLPTTIGGTLGGPGVGGPPAWAPAWGFRGNGGPEGGLLGGGGSLLSSVLGAPGDGVHGLFGQGGGGPAGASPTSRTAPAAMTLGDMLHATGYGGSEGVRY